MRRGGHFVDTLALVVVVVAACLNGMVAYRILWTPDIKLSESTLLGSILGTVNGAAFGVVVGYYFGRSTDSDRKTELLASATPATQPNVAHAASVAEEKDHVGAG